MSIQLPIPELKYQKFRSGVHACEYHIVFCTKEVLKQYIESQKNK